ncbi:MAG TPA: phosphatase PAP2 family protein [Steroidobacteraceae bacterium]
MSSDDLSALFERIDAAEHALCRRFNAAAALVPVRRVLNAASRLGDGVAWYVLIISLPILYGRSAVRPAIVMAATGIAGLLIYAWLKRTFVRERPLITHRASIAFPGSPLDRYSFPSGHTLHAVSFTWQAVAHYGDLGWVLIPFACLVAASRLVLGLHYLTDVLAGALLGALLAAAGLALF